MSKKRTPNSIDVPFLVPAVHRLRFTDDVFGQDQDALAAVLEASGDRPPRVQFWLDGDVASTNPGLVDRIKTFADAQADRLMRIGNVQLLPGGEPIKNDIHILERMLKVFNVSDLDRRSYVVAIGGGAVLDAVGFAAAIAHRGIRLVRLPTTTLAQGDSGVGVKNGVNLFTKKNWIGTFAVPWAVINDAKLLTTLSDRDFVCGFSESVKVSLLKDAAMFGDMCREAAQIRDRDMSVALPMLRRSAEWHLSHITQGGDPFEALEARPLDYGHWSAHKLETMSNFKIRHGEAVAIGVAIDTVYSSMAHGLPRRDADRVLACLTGLGFDLHCSEVADINTLFAGMEEFRQHLGGRLTLTMLRGVGDPIDVHEVDRDLMCQAIQQVGRYAESRATAQ
ncbi:MAG: 3-dehydroquinate synthase [Pirellulales bacterium]